MKKFVIHPASFILWLWIFVVLGVMEALSYVLAIVIHEVGHALAANKLGYRLSRFSISPYGVELAYFGQNLDYGHEIKIALAGPLFNLASIFLILGVWWLFPTTYFFTAGFVQISLALALVNLLPAYPLDGGRVFVGIFSKYFDGKLAKKITLAVNVVLSAVCFTLFFAFLFINFNPTFMLFGVFLVLGILDLKFVTKFEKVNVFLKNFKNFVKPNIVCVGADVKLCELISKMQMNKTELFVYIQNNGKTILISEKLVVLLASRFSINSTLGEIFEKTKPKIEIR